MTRLLPLITCGLFTLTAATAAPAREIHPLEQLITSARQGPASRGLAEMITTTLSPHGGVAVWGQEYLFATDLPFGTPNSTPVAAAEAAVSIDGQPALPMEKIPGSPFWMRLALMRVGVTHAYQYVADGKQIGRRFDVAGYNPLSYPTPGTPQGKISEKHTLTSKIYDGMTVDFWWYASAGVNPNTPAPLMVWQDGQGIIRGDLSALRLFTVTDNLVAEKRIPPMIHILVAPGFAPDGKAMRSIEYDTVSDRYPRFLLEEIFPQVEKEYKLRQDRNSRGIAGESSGAIASFNAAWFMPDKFTRVQSTIGSYTSIQWHPDEKQEGGYIFPFMVRKLPRRNIRVWMSDGTDDLENEHGSWPMQNIELANSLKMRDYDYHFRFGMATHDSAQAALDLPESLSWLWRGYDPAKTTQDYTIDPAEKDKPYYRVRIDNRDSW